MEKSSKAIELQGNEIVQIQSITTNWEKIEENNQVNKVIEPKELQPITYNWHDKPTKRVDLDVKAAKILLRDNSKKTIKIVDKNGKLTPFIYEPKDTMGATLNSILHQLNTNFIALKFAHSENKAIKEQIKDEDRPMKKAALKCQLIDTSSLKTSIIVLIEGDEFNSMMLLKANMFPLQLNETVLRGANELAKNLNAGLK